MSDKNRNMNDINDQKTAEQQAFSEEIRRRLAAPDSGKPTLEEFKVMVYKDREKRRKKRNALVACIVAAFIVGYLTYDDLVPEVGADKNPKETIQTEDGVIIEDGGWGSSTGEDDVWIIEDQSQICDAKKIYSNLVVPKYIPNNYQFQRLEIQLIDTGAMTCKYYYNKGDTGLEIEQNISSSDMSSINLGDYTEKIKLANLNIYLYEDENRATILLDDGVISIWGKVSQEEIIRIVDYMVL